MQSRKALAARCELILEALQIPETATGRGSELLELLPERDRVGTRGPTPLVGTPDLLDLLMQAIGYRPNPQCRQIRRDFLWIPEPHASLRSLLSALEVLPENK